MLHEGAYNNRGSKMSHSLTGMGVSSGKVKEEFVLRDVPTQNNPPIILGNITTHIQPSREPEENGLGEEASPFHLHTNQPTGHPAPAAPWWPPYQ